MSFPRAALVMGGEVFQVQPTSMETRFCGRKREPSSEVSITYVGCPDAFYCSMTTEQKEVKPPSDATLSELLCEQADQIQFYKKELSSLRQCFEEYKRSHDSREAELPKIRRKAK